MHRQNLCAWRICALHQWYGEIDPWSLRIGLPCPGSAKMASSPSAARMRISARPLMIISTWDFSFGLNIWVLNGFNKRVVYKWRQTYVDTFPYFSSTMQCICVTRVNYSTNIATFLKSYQDIHISLCFKVKRLTNIWYRVVHKWCHGLRWMGSIILWRLHVSPSAKILDNENIII